MLNKTIADLIQEQINKEFYSAYLYLGIADYYASKGLLGYENWFKIQAQEEMAHALLFRQYLLNNAVSIRLTEIANPSKEFSDFKAPLVEALEHEQIVSGSINDIYAEAMKLKDYKTMQFLDWFIREQGEEEKNAEENIQKYEVFGIDPKGLYMLNQELMARVFTPPTLVV